jgi:gamma-glutamylcyclotransferase (GGCT)/AIG2-like uncharacterized protein YtfP
MCVPFTDADHPAWPYPGTRPATSFVHDAGIGRPLVASSGWGWTVAGVSLDDWLSSRGALSLAERVPVLAYGSNANPSKITWLRENLGLPGPVVALRVRCTGLTAVWAAGPRVVDTQRPATLVAVPGRVEWHFVWLATREQVKVLDVCEGRDVRYRLVRLGSGTVATSDGVLLPDVLAYTGASGIRAPLMVDGAFVHCAAVSQAGAVGLVGVPGVDGLTVAPVVGAPSPDDWPDRLFVYGTLRPGDTAWPRLAGHTFGRPARAKLTGALYDTGRGYPALCGGDGLVPGWSVRLRSPSVALAELDSYEGPGYRRVRMVDSAGRLCWTYVWSGSTDGMRVLPEGW